MISQPVEISHTMLGYIFAHQTARHRVACITRYRIWTKVYDLVNAGLMLGFTKVEERFF